MYFCRRAYIAVNESVEKNWPNARKSAFEFQDETASEQHDNSVELKAVAVINSEATELRNKGENNVSYETKNQYNTQ